MPMKLAEVLHGWRHSEKLSIAEAAQIIGLPFDTYYRVERGGPMRPATFMRIITWLCGNEQL